MSDVNPEPRPGQVWRWNDTPYDDVILVRLQPGASAWDVFQIEGWRHYARYAMTSLRHYLREATPAERKAAGLPEEPCQAPDARVAELEARVADLTLRLESARRARAGWAGEYEIQRTRAEKAEAQRDAYLDGREMQRARADSAEAQANALVADYGAMLHRAERAEAALSAPPAPSLDALTAAEVAYVRAAISFHADTAGFSMVLEAAKRAAKGV